MESLNLIKSLRKFKMKDSVLITSLPEDFADQLLDLEMRVDKQCEIEQIKSLVSLYSVILM